MLCYVVRDRAGMTHEMTRPDLTFCLADTHLQPGSSPLKGERRSLGPRGMKEQEGPWW